VWADERHLVCEISDAGHLSDPLAGRRPAGLSINGGRGLLLVNHIADLVRTHTSPRGTSIRMYLTSAGEQAVGIDGDQMAGVFAQVGCVTP
jgi:hypothetical protein